MTNQIWAAAVVIIIGHAMALLYQTHYIDGRISDLNKRIDDLKELIRAEIKLFKMEIKEELKQVK